MAKGNPIAGLLAGLGRHKSAQTELMANVEAARARLRETAAKRREIQSAPVDAATVRERVASFLSSQVRHAQEFWINPFAAPDFNAARRDNMTTTMNRAPFGVLCLLGFGDQIARSLEAEAIAATPGGVTEAERTEALAVLDREHLQAEILIERLIRLGEEAGIEIARDESARPEIYLAKELTDV